MPVLPVITIPQEITMTHVINNTPFLTIPGVVITPLAQVQRDINEYLDTLTPEQRLRALTELQEAGSVMCADPDLLERFLEFWIADQRKFTA